LASSSVRGPVCHRQSGRLGRCPGTNAMRSSAKARSAPRVLRRTNLPGLLGAVGRSSSPPSWRASGGSSPLGRRLVAVGQLRAAPPRLAGAVGVGCLRKVGDRTRRDAGGTGDPVARRGSTRGPIPVETHKAVRGGSSPFRERCHAWTEGARPADAGAECLRADPVHDRKPRDAARSLIHLWTGPVRAR